MLHEINMVAWIHHFDALSKKTFKIRNSKLSYKAKAPKIIFLNVGDNYAGVCF